MNECIFCKIAAGDLPADLVYESEHVLAFRDLNPIAPSHCLVIPRKHITSSVDIQAEDSELIGEMHLAANKIAAKEGIDKTGFRTVMNCGLDGGQSVFHIHLHVLGGRTFSWPPG